MGSQYAKPLIEPSDPTGLSFRNLVELHVLSAIRRNHDVKMPAVRKALDYLKRTLRIVHPLWSQQMSTDGQDLFVEKYGKLINISQSGQLEMKQVVSAYLRRIERDTHGLPIRLFPYT